MSADPVSLSAEARRLALAWFLLAVTALLLAGVFAFMAAMTRTPAVRLLPEAEHFRISLVAHVTFSLTVWLLSFVALLWVWQAAGRGALSNLNRWWLGLGSAALGTAAMAFSAFRGQGQPILIDYIPFLKEAAFLGGLSLFLTGIGVSAINYLLSLARGPRPRSLPAVILGYAAAVYLLALVSLFVARQQWDGMSYGDLFWGGGHLLQVVNAAAMTAVWLLLLPASSLMKTGGRFLRPLFSLFLFAGVAVPLLHVLPVADQRAAIGTATWLGLGIPAAAVGAMSVAALKARGMEVSKQHSSYTALTLSLLLFGVGVLIASLGVGSDTRVPAHYHAAIGAVTIAFMGTSYQLLPALGLKMRARRLPRLQLCLYGAGVMLLVSGFFVAGILGAPRKAFETFSTDPGVLIVLNLMGMGAIVAMLGGAAFVWAMGTAFLTGKRPLPLKRPEQLSRASDS